MIKEIFSKFFNNKNEHPNEIGMAVNEENNNNPYQPNKEKLVVAKSTKEWFLGKLRGNAMYIVIILALIVPAFFKLVGFFNEGETPTAQPKQVIAFNEVTGLNTPIESDSLENLESKEASIEASIKNGLASTTPFPEAVPPEAPINTMPVPESVPAEETMATIPVPESVPATEPIITTPEPESAPIEAPIITTPVPEARPPENAANEVKKEEGEDATRSMLAGLFSIGGGSTASSDSMKGEELAELAPIPVANVTPVSTVAQVEGTKSSSADQILQGYFEQETKVESQLNALLSRVEAIEKNAEVASMLEERLATIENSQQLMADEQLEKVQTQLTQLEQGVHQLQQHAKAQMASMMQTRANAASVPANDSGITVEAVIPGRAWVRNQEGVLMVVSVGDEITGVGKVTRIDAREGTVATATQLFRQ